MFSASGYAAVYPQGYGRIDSTSPAEGLATDRVASAIVVIMHCPNTQRSTMSHSPNFLFQSTFFPMIEWVTGGPREKVRQMSAIEVVSFVGGLGARPSTLDVVVLRGWMYAKPDASLYKHDSWISDFRGMFTHVATGRRITLNIVDFPEPLSTGVVRLQRGTGNITQIQMPSGVKNPPLGLRMSRASLYDEAGFTLAQSAQSTFVANVRACRIHRDHPPIHLQFYIDSYRLHDSLDDEMRQLVRSVCLNQPSSARSKILATIGLSRDWANVIKAKDGESTMLRMTLVATAEDRPCELCPKAGGSTWYVMQPFLLCKFY